jgi:hypothetical protein
MDPGASSDASTVAMPVTGSIKGAAFREFLEFCERRFGADWVRTGVARLPSSDQVLLAPGRPALGLLSSTWYPAGLVHRLLDALVVDLGPAARKTLVVDGARAVMDATLRGVYRTFFALVATPERYARFAGKLWGAYYDSGQFVVQQVTATEADCTIRGWTAHHDLICDLNWQAARCIYEEMGCEGVEVDRLSCVGRGDPFCRFRTRWRRRR